jgi:FdhE protein
MTTVGKSRGAAIDIGEVAAPPFVRLPVPEAMFVARAARLRALAVGHALADALAFFAVIAEAQHAIQGDLEPSAPSSSGALAQALEHGMPPLNRYTWTSDRDFRAIAQRLAVALGGAAMPASAEVARGMVASADDRQLDGWATDLLAAEPPAEAPGPAVFVGAALQVHFARLASTLDADALKPIGHGVCPCCGTPPVASAVVGWPGARGLELHPHQMRRLRQHQGHRLLRLRGRKRRRQSRDVRDLRRLSQGLPAAQGHRDGALCR